MATRPELRDRIKRMLGCGMIRVEVTDDQIDDGINLAREKWITWAVGNATEEVYFTILLKAGKWLYDLPAGVVDIIGFDDRTHNSVFGVFEPGGINTLFSMDNHMYSNGMLNPWSSSFMGVGYEIALGFIETMDKYHPDKYQFRYIKHTNQIEIYPVPCGNSFILSTPTSGSSGSDNPCDIEYNTVEVDSPGYVLLRSQMIEGSTLPTYTPAISGSNDPDYSSKYDISERYSESLFDETWIIEYTLAQTKMVLGYTRRKLENFTALGNAGIPLDGSSLYQEGNDDARRLEEELDIKHSHTGYGIYMGAC